MGRDWDTRWTSFMEGFAWVLPSLVLITIILCCLGSIIAGAFLLGRYTD